jgi:hypothetical protein
MRTCPFAQAAFGVSTPLTVSSRATHVSISQNNRSWDSPFEAFSSHLNPTGFRFRIESRTAKDRTVHSQPLPACCYVVCCSQIASSTSHPGQLSGVSLSESSSTARGCYAVCGPLLPWDLPLQGFLHSRPKPAFAGLPLSDLHRWSFDHLRRCLSTVFSA